MPQIRPLLVGLTVAVAAVLLVADRTADERPPPGAFPVRPAVPERPSLAIGLTEANPALIWSAASGVDVGAFAPWRDRVAALRPRYLRIVVDWARLQPDPARPPDVGLAGDGCVRGIAPCRPFGGLRELLRAIASQQRAGGGFEVVLTFASVPAWAARPASGCERPGIEPRSRPITPAGLEGYRALIRSFLALEREEHVALRWWSPWNEANGSFFVSPQRATCDPASPSLGPALYTELFRAARDELRAARGDHRLVVGELADVVTRKPFSSSAAEVLGALPDDVMCSAAVVAQHAYADTTRGPGDPGVVAGVERILARRACTRSLPIWITETGAGAPHAGSARLPGEEPQRAACGALDAALRRWWADPRVSAAFQYTYRDDPAFPVGLADPGLTRTWPTGDLLAAWGGARSPEAPPPALPASCPAGA